MISYKTQGTSPVMINVELDGDVIKKAEFIGGCPGNIAGLEKVVVGRKAEEIIGLFDGITCGRKPTSCPDQLAKALKLALAQG